MELLSIAIEGASLVPTAQRRLGAPRFRHSESTAVVNERFSDSYFREIEARSATHQRAPGIFGLIRAQFWDGSNARWDSLHPLAIFSVLQILGSFRLPLRCPLSQTSDAGA